MQDRSFPPAAEAPAAMTQQQQQQQQKEQQAEGVAVVGGGLVGALAACFLARRGYQVDVYEAREDIRTAQLVQGRSINLALSSRGRAALRAVGLEEALLSNHGLPMRGRMLHTTTGDTRHVLYDPQHHQCIYSVGRKYLNEVLLSAAEKFPNVRLHFNHKLVAADLHKGNMVFQILDNGLRVEKSASLVVGADGAFSAVRRQMMKAPLFQYSQRYIEHGYLELCIPPTADGKFAMAEQYLHIWPRGSFMMIALPNQDRSWTVTLFMPFEQFEALDTPQRLLDFFGEYFADSIPLIGSKKLVKDFFATKPSPLVSIKCKPYHVGSSTVIIGDAAHAMVPFYGQGMNAGFEDCLLLDELLASKGQAEALFEFSRLRSPDAHAIVDLAMYNYIEMRDLVTRSSFLIRKRVDLVLQRLMPALWVPLYTSVTFSSMRYHKCLQNKHWQDKVMQRVATGATVVAVAAAAALVWGGVRLLLQEVGPLRWLPQLA
ncbi:kynurenine 3-monooxygenase-like [Schistocerca americana]|uniref:kynurenine 3-monooxygenase-like n=1 Tax=Schistocerca americana TaxID=7009 RepID=UPI001F4F528F|nr:kynurenine 3-monooxygenase-like [Schistocerca americana]